MTDNRMKKEITEKLQQLPAEKVKIIYFFVMNI